MGRPAGLFRVCMAFGNHGLYARTSAFRLCVGTHQTLCGALSSQKPVTVNTDQTLNGNRPRACTQTPIRKIVYKIIHLMQPIQYYWRKRQYTMTEFAKGLQRVFICESRRFSYLTHDDGFNIVF